MSGATLVFMHCKDKMRSSRIAFRGDLLKMTLILTVKDCKNAKVKTY